MERNYQTLRQEEIRFLHQIRRELSLKNLKETIGLVAPVLQALRQTLTLQNANALIDKLPDLLKLVFISNWKRNEGTVAIEHLDEFVNLVMYRERNNKKHFFRNEVQTLSAVILTLKSLYKLIDLGNFEGLSQAMRQELRDVTLEAAA